MPRRIEQLAYVTNRRCPIPTASATEVRNDELSGRENYCIKAVTCRIKDYVNVLETGRQLARPIGALPTFRGRYGLTASATNRPMHGLISQDPYRSIVVGRGNYIRRNVEHTLATVAIGCLVDLGHAKASRTSRGCCRALRHK